MNLKTIGAVAIVGGIGLEILQIGSSVSLGTLIAGAGIVAVVYAIMAKSDKRPL
jgi:hypothetical protein